MASQLTIPRIVISPGGPLTSPSLAVPDGDTLMRLSIDRTIANGLNASPATAVLTLYVDQSNDGGVNWLWTGGAQLTGGIFISPKLGQLDTDYIEVGLNPATSRLVRGRVAIIGGGGSVAIAGTLITS